MTTQAATRCARGISDRTLSDFRSDGLHAKEMERLRAHVEQCPACQGRLDAYEALARALRSQPELDGHAQLWQNVRASIAAAPSATQQRRRAGAGTRSHSAQFWAALGSVAAIVALSAGFLALFVSRGGWPPAATTQTRIVIHSGSLTWRQVVTPKGFPSVDQFSEEQASTYSGATIAPSDGNTAYACQANKHKVSSPVVWATHDAGTSWSVITPPDIPATAGGCRLTVDANDANTLVVSVYQMLSSSRPALPDKWVTYASDDGGATWTKPAGLNDGSVIMTLASARGKVYASRVTYTSSGTPQEVSHDSFSVSSDRMRTWTQIDANLPETRPNPPDIAAHTTEKTFETWVNAMTGEVLDLTYVGSLWSTADDGAHWTSVPYPVNTDPRNSTLFVGTPTASTYLTICGSFTPVGADSEQWLECTTDDGKTWIKRPDLTATGLGLIYLSMSGIGADGSIYATANVPPNQGNGNVQFYRLAPEATTTAGWQRLGAIPDSQNAFGFQIVSSATSTLFWLFPVTGTVSDSSGTKTYTQPYYYVATYP